MWSKVENYISNYNLLNANDLYIVALSGGADSVALLSLLDEMGYSVHAAHCNFRLRGAESDRDEAFCESLCAERNIPFHRVHFDTFTYAELHKVSIEMAARELRYKWFEQLREDIGASGICVAHHRDDSVETVLLNLVRGTGLRGLCGIRPRNGHILRPLLCVSRAEIEAYLGEKGQRYVTDSTNLEADVQRNKIRLQVLPLLQTLNPAVAENICRTADILSEAQALIVGVVDSYNDSNVLDLNELRKFGSSEYIIFEWLRKYGFNGSQIHQIMSAETGSIFTSLQGYELLVDRGRLLVEPALSSKKDALICHKPLVIPEEGIFVLDEKHCFSVKKKPAYISKDPAKATVDVSKVVFPLTLRGVEDGDRMIPYGMRGHKLLSDMMTDRKMSHFDKRRQLVVVDAHGIVVWLVGIRIDHRVAVSDTTDTVLELFISERSS